jgi:hypothetical protein
MSAAAVVEARWQRWRAAKDAVNQDWLKAQLERVAEIAKEVDRDKQRTAMEAEEKKRDDYFRQDYEENQQFVSALAAAHQAKVDAWKKSAQERLTRATRQINREVVERERRIFGVKRRHS